MSPRVRGRQVHRVLLTGEPSLPVPSRRCRPAELHKVENRVTREQVSQDS